MIRYIKSSLQRKLMLMVSTIVVLVATTIGSFSYFKSSSAIEADAQRFSNQILKQATLNLTRYIGDNKHFFESIASSQDIQDWSRIKANGNYANWSSIKGLEEHFITPYINYHPETLSIMLYNVNGNEMIYRNDGFPDAYLNTDFKLASLSIHEKFMNSEGFQFYVGLRNDYRDSKGNKLQLPILTYIQKLTFNKEVVYLIIDISLLHTQKILNEIELGQNGITLISDSAGKIISAPNLQQINSKLDTDIIAKMGEASSGYVYDKLNKRLLVFQSISPLNWRVVAFVPYSDLTQRILEIRNWTVLMTLISLCIAVLLVFFVSHSITKRIKILRRTIRTTKTGQVDVRSDVKGTDEVAELAETYNLLLDRIDASIQQLALSRLVQQRAILSALQSQINSHFLYNALESINSMANVAGHREICQSAFALSRMLRYTSNYTESLVTLEDELTHVRHYMQIMENLYWDGIRCEIQVDPDLDQVQCLKAIIQPFIENCVKHGFEVTGDNMQIRICATKVDQDYVMIEIVDDGIGLSDERLKSIHDSLSTVRTEQEFLQLTSIGIMNVHYRLKTYYPLHEKTGISVEKATMGGGTRVRVIFPYRVEE